MLGVIIHFLIQLTIVVLTAGEDFAERRLLFVFNCRSNMMLQASLDCFLGSPNKEWKKKCQQQLHPSWVWSILSIIKGGRTWFSRLNWICLFDFYFLFHRTEFKYTSESGGKKNTGKKKKKLFHLSFTFMLYKVNFKHETILNNTEPWKILPSDVVHGHTDASEMNRLI